MHNITKQSEELQKNQCHAYLKDMVESSPAKNTAFSQKVMGFLNFFFLTEGNMGKNREGEEKNKTFLWYTF